MVGYCCYVERFCDMEGRVLNVVMSIYMEQMMVVMVVCSIGEIGENMQVSDLIVFCCCFRLEEVFSRIYLLCIEVELGKNNCLNVYQLIFFWVFEWVFSYLDVIVWWI